jgi:hypothetical protein
MSVDRTKLILKTVFPEEGQCSLTTQSAKCFFNRSIEYQVLVTTRAVKPEMAQEDPKPKLGCQQN